MVVVCSFLPMLSQLFHLAVAMFRLSKTIAVATAVNGAATLLEGTRTQSEAGINFNGINQMIGTRHEVTQENASVVLRYLSTARSKFVLHMMSDTNPDQGSKAIDDYNA